MHDAMSASGYYGISSITGCWYLLYNHPTLKDVSWNVPTWTVVCYIIYMYHHLCLVSGPCSTGANPLLSYINVDPHMYIIMSLNHILLRGAWFLCVTDSIKKYMSSIMLFLFSVLESAKVQNGNLGSLSSSQKRMVWHEKQDCSQEIRSCSVMVYLSLTFHSVMWVGCYVIWSQDADCSCRVGDSKHSVYPKTIFRYYKYYGNLSQKK